MLAGKSRMFVLAMATCAVVACSPQIRNHGYVPNDESLSQITVGRDDRESVAQVLGSPTSAAMMRDDGWYYISSQMKHMTYHAPEEIERQIVAISFDKRGIVSNVERLSLQDGRVIALNRRITDIPVKGPRFFQQLLGSFGNINLADAI